jgi:hypothetical protein
MESHRDIACVINLEGPVPTLEAYTPLSSIAGQSNLSQIYLSACDIPEEISMSSDSPFASLFTLKNAQSTCDIPPELSKNPDTPFAQLFSLRNTQSNPYNVFASKKYKPVAKKVRPVLAELPDKFRIVRNITGDPLAGMPTLNPCPPPFVPTQRYSKERRDIVDKNHPGDFLWPQERELMHHFIRSHPKGFAFDDSERGRFRSDFFPPVEIPTVPHTPWVQKNIPIPPGIFEDVCEVVKQKIDAGVYEPSNSSYRSRWFCVMKKNGKLRAIQSLEPLNKVTIAHSGVPPIPEHLAEQFGGRTCGAMLDLYVGYDERQIAESSRDLTTFQTPFGAMRLVSLPMGWTNSVPIFHDDVTYILQPEIPHLTIPYIDDVPVKGPKSYYRKEDGSFETIPENPGIRRFVWEHFQNLNRIVQRMEYSGGTFSGLKLYLCVPEFVVLGMRCTPQGRIPDDSKILPVKNWGPCKSLSDVRAFLGTIGTCRMFIQNFAKRANAISKLLRHGIPFEFGPEQIAAQEDLKQALINSPALRAIDYKSESPVILAVDTSPIAIGFFLCQCDEQDPKKRYYSRFGSITLGDRESRFSQAKLELYGLFRALKALHLYIIGIRNLVVEVDAKYIKGMLAHPDLAPGASINRWIVGILEYHFTLVHVPGTNHGPDGLSRRPLQPGESIEEYDDDDFEDWVDCRHGFIHQINPIPCIPHSNRTGLSLSLDLSEEETAPLDVAYDSIPRSDTAMNDDKRILKVRKWHSDLKRPEGLSDAEYSTFLRYCTDFFLDGDRLWRKDPQGAHKLVVEPSLRIKIMRSAHDDIGHKAVFATQATVSQRFWWPNMKADIAWFVRTCHLCQLRQTKNVLIPPVVATPAPLFAKVFMDTMHMPPSGSYKFIVQGRCSLTHYPEFRMLRKESAKSIGDWIYEDILCRWGSLREIVTDNGRAFVSALEYLAKQYKINHIRISGYNSRANGIVERSHFDVRQSLFKAADGEQQKWSLVAHSVFWAERVTYRRRMGCSPYFAVTGSHPVLPFDIFEATYIQPAPGSILSRTDLIARRAIALQKRSQDINRLYSNVYDARRQAALRFERDHEKAIHDFDFKRGDLVLLRNTQIEKSLNRKMRPRYLGPLIVISRNYGGAYIICELDGTVYHQPVAAFRLLPYFPRTSIPIPDSLLDIDTARLRELESQEDPDDEEPDEEVMED